MPHYIDYTLEWQRLGYPKGMASASFLPPPSAHFVRAYHMSSSAHALSDIRLRRRKVTRFLEANDPFELLALNCHDRRVRRLTSRFREAQNAKTGFLSFSQDWTSPLLWSHYAERHGGMCLGFDLRRTDEVQFIKYCDERVRAHLPEDRDPIIIPESVQEQLFRIKSRDWEYEQEIRQLVEIARAMAEGPRHFRSFDHDLQLAEVILGPRCEEDLSTVRALVAATHPKAVVFKGRLAFRSFRVVLDGRTRPRL